MSRPLYRSELLGAEVAYLLTIEWGGVTYRWSTRPCAPVDADGTIHVFDGQIGDVDLTLSFELFATAPELVSVPFSLLFPVDVALRVARGFDLATATGELALWVDGTAWEDRRVLLNGDVVNPSYGADAEPVDFSLEQPPFSDAGSLIASTAVVSDDTWNDRLGDQAVGTDGLAYPFIIGAPGYYDTLSSGPTGTSGSRAIVVDDGSGNADTLLIAGHPVVGTRCRIFSTTNNETFDITVTTDGLGLPVSVVDVTSAGTLTRSGTDYWVVWQDGASGTVQGGFPGIYDTPFLEGAGDVLLFMLQRSTLTVDVGRCQAAAALLNHIKIGAMIDEPVTPWDWLTDNLLPLLPMSLVSGPDGVYPVVWRYDATTTDAVIALTEGEQVERTSPVEYEQARRDVYNEFRLSYAKRLRTEEWKRQIVLKAEPDTNARGEHGSVYAWVSQNRYGNRVLEMESDILYREASASAVLAWMLRAQGFATRTVSYEGGVELAWLELGAVVTITDADVSLTAQVAIIGAMTIAPASTSLTLVLVEDVARDMHSA